MENEKRTQQVAWLGPAKPAAIDVGDLTRTVETGDRAVSDQAQSIIAAPHSQAARLSNEPGPPHFARNEAKLLLALLAYEMVHVARTALEAVTGTGWSLKRTRRTVLTAAGRLLRGGRRLTLAIEARHADLWTRLWRRIQTWAWALAAP